MPSNAVSRMNLALQRREFVKVIAGIENFDRTDVLAIVAAATQARAHAVDIAADAELIEAVKAATDLCVFVSATEPAQLVMAAHAGADVLELGNFDAMYACGQEPTAEQILGWTREVKAAVGDAVPLCVTISGRLPLEVQLDLATSLQAAGADLIQAEGVLGPQPVVDAASSIAAIASALANASALHAAVELPLFVAGGITPDNASFAAGSGACGVGVGRAVSRLASHEAKLEAIARIVDGLSAVRREHRGLATV